MKSTAADPKATTQVQNKDARPQSGGAANQGTKSNTAASASHEATERAKRGEPLQANKPSERSPKQENL